MKAAWRVKIALGVAAFLLIAAPATAALPHGAHAHAHPTGADIFVPDPAGLFQAPEGIVESQVLAGNPDYYRSQSASEYTLDFRCPPMVSSDIEDARCPAYVLDTEDIMSQGVLLVDPRTPSLIAFNALHGAPGARLPTAPPPASEISRDNAIHQPHTTFQSQDGGKAWVDNRYYTRLPETYAEVFGEDNAAALDHQGRITLASLYAFRKESGDPLSYTFLIWKAGRINVPVEYDNDWIRLDPREAGAEVRAPSLVFDGNTHRMSLFWLEGPAGAGHIQGAWTNVDEGSVWERYPESSVLGPCSDITNAVESSDRIYIGCFAAEGYVLPDVGGTNGDLLIHRFDPATGNQTFQGVAPLAAPSNAVLASAEAWSKHGLAVAGAGVDGPLPALRVSMGVAGKDWSATANLGERFTDRLSPNRTSATLIEARVTAAAYVSVSGTVHFLYQERYATQSGDASTLAPTGPGPFFKTYGVSHGGGFLGRFDFGHGDPQARVTYGARTAGSNDGVFGDRHDSIVVVGGTVQQRIFMAAGDHGYERIAEVIEDNQPTPLPPFPATAAPFPAPIPAINPAVVGAVAGALALSIVARMAAARNKKAAETPS